VSRWAICAWSTWVGGQTDRVLEALRLQVLVHVGQREGRIAAQQSAQVLATIPRNHRVEHLAPTVGAVDVARAERASLQIPVLVEHKERVITGAGEVAVVGRALLRAVGRAHAAVDVEHQRGSCALPLRAVDPPPREIGERRQVRRRGHRARLEAAHLARGRGRLRHRAAADDRPHRGIVPQAVSIVHVLVAGEAPEHRLTKLSDQAVAPVPPDAGVGEHLARHCREAERVIEFPEGKQTGIGSDGRTVEFELQAAVERDPQPAPHRFTRRLVHPAAPSIATKPVPLIADSRARVIARRGHLGNAG
jgi:hypothetical protein